MEDLKRNIIKNSIYLFLFIVAIALVLGAYGACLYYEQQGAIVQCALCYILGGFSVPLFYGLFSVNKTLAEYSQKYRTLKAIEKIRERNNELKDTIEKSMEKVYILECYENSPDDGEITRLMSFSTYDKALEKLNEFAIEAKRNFKLEFDNEFEEYHCGECEITYATQDDKYVVRLKIRQTTMDA